MGIAMIIQLLYETAIILFFFCLSPSDVCIYLFLLVGG